MTNQKSASLSRADIAGTLAAKFEIPIAQAEAFAREYETAILRATSAGQQVRLPGFGVFQLQERGARMGRNPRTGEAIQIPTKNVIKFTPSNMPKVAGNPGATTDNVITQEGAVALTNPVTTVEEKVLSEQGRAQSDAVSQAPKKKSPRKLGSAGAAKG